MYKRDYKRIIRAVGCLVSIIMLAALGVNTVFCVRAFAAASVTGDVDSDGSVSDWDAVMLNRYLAGWNVSIGTRAADTDADGNVTDMDAILLERYLAGWDVRLENGDNADEPIDTVIHQESIYGYSTLGRELVCHILSPSQYEKTILINFTIHGFEDDFAYDGQILTDTANYLIDHYKSTGQLHNTRLMIVPTANPDGLIDGTTNNGFGRCNADGIDLNRDFDADHIVDTRPRNYTPYPFSAVESRALRDLVLEYRPDIVLDMHGWLNTTIGDGEIASVFYEEVGLPHQTEFNTRCNGYFANWAHDQGALGLLVEFKNPDIDKAKLINAIDRLITDEYNVSDSDW